MKKIFTCLLFTGLLLFITNSVFACENCKCNDEIKCNCAKEQCDCGCQKNEKCTCDCCKNCTCKNCKCCKKKILGIFKRKCKCK